MTHQINIMKEKITCNQFNRHRKAVDKTLQSFTIKHWKEKDLFQSDKTH